MALFLSQTTRAVAVGIVARSMSREARITGVGSTGAGDFEGSTPMSLHADAAFAAIEDAGLKPHDIDGVLGAYSLVEPQAMMATAFMEYAGLKPAVCMTISNAGATAAMMVMQAAVLIEQGYCRHVLVVAGDNRLSGLRG